MVVLSNFFAPQEGIRHEEQNTTLYVGDREIGKGTLYITESVLVWLNSTTQQGFALEYPSISLHATSRDQMVHPRQCLYVMVNTKLDLPDVELDQNEGNDSGEDDDSETSITEMRFAPDNVNNLDAMFHAMNQCQALHPDPQDSFSDAEEDIYEDAEEEDDFEYYEVGGDDASYILPSEQTIGNHNGNDADEAMDVEAGQFEDAEEDP
ncbi:methylosome subunit pICln [Diachasma alloeum]|uniref:methylosome subunit pICln n=1 Tax=Diachasma alloeum TaxID=454923 RepID=UPI0007382D0D|nr:methylosome subunit pICln [Diachasma alloeum]